MLASTYERSQTGQLWDDFLQFNASLYTDTKSGAPAALAVALIAGGALGGWLNAPTVATLNAYRSFSTAPIFECLPARPMQAEARILISEAALNSSSWYFGFTDVLATGFLSSGGFTPASYHGVVFFKPFGSTQIHFEVANGSTKVTIPNVGSFVSGSPVLLSIQYDPQDPAPGLAAGPFGAIRPLINTMGMDAKGDNQSVPIPALRLALTGMAPMYLSAGIVASTAAAELLSVDYLGAEFYR